ncbi:hypothetical protein X801_10462 [Opisthorchis viverrini]|uniref:Uncharacterized protein n=1 Tax=Opisthorchis viverrini TaxID=6198 RepID=A0A1S8WH33_OPIVI|nr:hypothetical protein X801_10462 [Opisthorchis viverrini]
MLGIVHITHPLPCPPKKRLSIYPNVSLWEEYCTRLLLVNELAVQRELADRRADRLDQRITELLEARSAAGAREHELRSELKEAVRMCAEIEAKVS